MAVPRRHQRGEAVEQLQRGEDQRGGRAGTGAGVVVDEAIGIEFAQSFQGERWPRAIPPGDFVARVLH